MEKTSKLTTKKLIIIIATIFLICACGLGVLAYARNYIKEVASDNPYGYVNPDETKAETDEGFKIDGILDEKEYQNNNWLYLHNNEGGADVDIAMTSYYGEKGMYFVYDVTEGNPIYVNTERPSYLNSCVEMYLASSSSTKMRSNSVFEIDLLPSGDMSFKKSNGVGGFTSVATTKDIMAVLGATTKGGDLNTKDCYGYYLELFIPWEYMEYLDMDTKVMKETFVYVDPAHITSFNYAGTDLNVDRYWYFFAQQYGADYSDVYQYFQFNGSGALQTVPVKLVEGDNYTITGYKAVIPGMKSQVTITPEKGYAISSVLVNGEEYLKKLSYNEDGSVELNIRGEKEGLEISVATENVTEGNKTLSGTVNAHAYSGGNLNDISISYMGPTGEKPIELDSKGKFVLPDLKQGYYKVTVEKQGYEKLVRNICVNRDMDVDLTLEYQMFMVESGTKYILDEQNEGVLNYFGSRGTILTNDTYNKFTVETNLNYDTKLEKEAEHDHFAQQRSGIRIKFNNEKFLHVDILKEYGSYRVAYAKHTGDKSVFDWTTVYKLSESESKKYESAKGVKLEVQRDGKYLAVYLDDKLVAAEILDDAYVNCTAQVGFESWTANRQVKDMKYKITRSTEKNIKNVYFKRPSKWDITGQYDGYVTLPKDHEYKSGWLVFDKMYANVNVAVMARDYNIDDKDERLALELDFGNKITFCATITNDADKTGTHMVQGMGDSFLGWENLYTLTDEQVAKYQSEEGIELRVIRKGTVAGVYLDGIHVADADLTVDRNGKATNVKADSKSRVAIYSYGNIGCKVDVPFKISETVPETIKIDLIKGDKGSPATDKIMYQLGETVVLSGDCVDGYYCYGFKIDGGEFIPVNQDRTYSFKVTKNTYKVEGFYAKDIFVGDLNYSQCWDTSKQYKEDVFYLNHNCEKPSDDHYTYVGKANAYQDVDFTVKVKEQVQGDERSRAAMQFKYNDKKIVKFWLYTDEQDPNVVKVTVRTVGADNANTNDKENRVYTLTKDEVTKYRTEGIDLRVVRHGTTFLLYIDGNRCDLLDSAKVTKNNAIELEETGDIAVENPVSLVFVYTGVDDKNETIPFPYVLKTSLDKVKITEKASEDGTVLLNSLYLRGDIVTLRGKGTDGKYCYGFKINDGELVEVNQDGSYRFTADEDNYEVEGLFAENIFTGWKTDSCWDFTKQYKNIISVEQVCANTKEHGTYIGKANAYQNLDFTVKVKEQVNGNERSRTALQFKYNDSKIVKFWIYTDENNADDVKITVRTVGKDNKNTNDADWRVYTLTASEVSKYRSEGIELRVVRVGTTFLLYIDGVRCDLKESSIISNNAIVLNESGDLKAENPISLVLVYTGVSGINETVVFPYKINTNVKLATINENASSNGTVKAKNKLNVVGDTVVLQGVGNEGYYCSAIKVDGTPVEMKTDGTYSFVANKDSYSVEGTFAKKIFQDNPSSNYTAWNLLQQNQGEVTLTNGRTGTKGIISSTIKKGAGEKFEAVYFKDKYTDMDFTINLKNDPNTADNGLVPETMIVFDFGDGKVLRLSITQYGDEALIRTREGIIDWKRLTMFTAAQTAKYNTAEGINLRVVRKGTQLYLSIDGVECKIGQAAHGNDTRFYAEDHIDLAALTSNYIKADTTATVSVRRCGDEGTQQSMAFTITNTVTNLFTGWKTDSCWDFSKQYIDVISLKKTCTSNSEHGTYIGAAKAYNDLDFAIKVKETMYGTTPSGASIQISFNDKKLVKLWLQNNGQEVIITARTVGADGKNTNNADWRVYTLSSAEVTKYQSEGIEWRVVRQGTELMMYIDGQRCNLKSSSIVKDNKISFVETGDLLAANKVSLAFVYYHPKNASVTVDFPYKLYTSVK